MEVPGATRLPILLLPNCCEQCVGKSTPLGDCGFNVREICSDLAHEPLRNKESMAGLSYNRKSCINQASHACINSSCPSCAITFQRMVSKSLATGKLEYQICGHPLYGVFELLVGPIKYSWPADVRLDSSISQIKRCILVWAWSIAHNRETPRLEWHKAKYV